MNNQILFSSVYINKLKISNRFIRSATQDYLANENGEVSEKQIKLYDILGKNNIGLIITGLAYVSENGISTIKQLGVSADKFIKGLAKLTSIVHKNNGIVFIQLAHSGRQTKKRLLKNIEVVAPSAIYDNFNKHIPRELTDEEIKTIIKDFIMGARRAEFDGVQLHSAHGYLLSEFISPYTNMRTDSWGGDVYKRSRILKEIVSGIKEKCGADFPVTIKLNATDGINNGLKADEFLIISELLQKAGADMIEVSGGIQEVPDFTVRKNILDIKDEAYFKSYSKMIKDILNIPIGLVGGIRSVDNMIELIKNGCCDFISMARPFIRQPNIVQLIKDELIKKSDCISCNKCFNFRGIKCNQL